MNVLFLGDSITDWFRDHNDPTNMGKGYASFASKALLEKHPGTTFLNLGVNGYPTAKVAELAESGEIPGKPDIVSILVGVNDFCDIDKPKDWTPDLKAAGENYRRIFRALKKRFGAEIVMLQPYLAGEHHPYFSREHLILEHAELAAAMSDENVTNLVPLDKIINESFPGERAKLFSKDGVHPLPEGAEFLGNVVADAIGKIIEMKGQIK